MSDVSDLLTKNQILCLISDRLSAENAILRADLAAVTEERDRMREALRPFDDFPLHKWDGIGDDHVLYGPFTLGHVRKYLSGSCQAILDNSNYPEKPDSCARAAIEGVTEQERQS